jgi:dUTPase
MVVCKLPDVDLVEDYEDNALRNESQRAGGFGHTGV